MTQTTFAEFLPCTRREDGRAFKQGVLSVRVSVFVASPGRGGGVRAWVQADVTMQLEACQAWPRLFQ